MHQHELGEDRERRAPTRPGNHLMRVIRVIRVTGPGDHHFEQQHVAIGQVELRQVVPNREPWMWIILTHVAV